MNFVSYNIQYGFGADGRYDLARVVDAVRGADVIALQEVERFWRRSGDDDQPASIAALLPDYYQVYGPAFDMDASRRLEDGRIDNRRRQFGTMLLSRLPLVWSRLHPLPMRRTVGRLNTQNAALEAMIRTPSGPVRVFSIHLAHIAVEERLEEIDYLLARHRQVPWSGGPWTGTDDEPHRSWSNGEAEPENPVDAVWLGDFNSEPDSAEYRRITGTTPYHAGADYADLFTDAAAAAGGGDVYTPTHRREVDGAPQRRRLDYAFVSGALARRVRGYRVDQDAAGSDHQPVWIDIDL